MLPLKRVKTAATQAKMWLFRVHISEGAINLNGPPWKWQNEVKKKDGSTHHRSTSITKSPSLYRRDPMALAIIKVCSQIIMPIVFAHDVRFCFKTETEVFSESIKSSNDLNLPITHIQFDADIVSVTNRRRKPESTLRALRLQKPPFNLYSII